jgi:glycosyltransferase involved in cell wall biosynthesis
MSLLFYDDSPVFGGHEVMALLGLEAVLAVYPGPVRFFAAAANTKLCDRVREIAAGRPSLTLELLDEHSSKLEALRNRVKPARVVAMARRFEACRPSLVVAIQGNIEHSSLALHAARRAGIRVASYIPVPHSNAGMGARFGAARDLFTKGLFRMPDAFVTISGEMERLLRTRGTDAPIHIVYNGVDTNRFQPGDSSAARGELGLPMGRTLIGQIGRIEFRQKQQHLLVEAVASRPDLAAACHLVFAGEGPDSGRLHSLVETRNISATILPWVDPAGIYRALDALVIPSRYEGLPLVMLEALATGTAVLGSDRDGMRDLLPSGWRFQPDSIPALASVLADFLARGCPSPDPALTARVRETMSLEAFRRNFAATLLDLADST